jgi:hypothetical protein
LPHRQGGEKLYIYYLGGSESLLIKYLGFSCSESHHPYGFGDVKET